MFLTIISKQFDMDLRQIENHGNSLLHLNT